MERSLEKFEIRNKIDMTKKAVDQEIATITAYYEKKGQRHKRRVIWGGKSEF